MSAVDKIRAALQTQSALRIEPQESDRPKYTTYQGDGKIRQLGQEVLDNNQLLSNASVAIGDPVMPLAIGSAIRRVDSVNGGANLGTAYRRALENDALASGTNRNLAIGRNGGLPSNPNNPNFPNSSTGNLPKKFPPPNGCVPVSPSCFWSDQPTAPNGYQGYGDAVVNEDGLPLYLYCKKGVTPPNDLGCDFLKPTKWACSGGICFLSPTGIYNSQAECEAALLTYPANGFPLPIPAPAGLCAERSDNVIVSFPEGTIPKFAGDPGAGTGVGFRFYENDAQAIADGHTTAGGIVLTYYKRVLICPSPENPSGTPLAGSTTCPI